ncbi:MAG: TetR/AcrR family transcriptional regulator [Gammaproteobacteria bacterium]|jgi:AcrR family transcriptional regulator|nr:TetR/AcrR family transcriptional regulator [Gammaproteobacteria bacterium]
MKAGQASHARINTGTATRQRGKSRVKSIILTAKNIFLREGYENLKLKNVAAEEGISLGNLTYYFKTKEHLYRTLIEDVLNQYNVDANRFKELYSDDPVLKFTKFIEMVLKDCKKQETRAFFYQLWSNSIHDEFIRDCRTAVYDDFLISLRDLARDINPKLDEKQFKQRTFIVISMIEGLHVMFGNYNRLPRYMQGFEKEFQEQALSVITK